MVRSICGFICALTIGAQAEAVLYDHDFTSGDAGNATVIGGQFDNGWKQVRGEPSPGRIVFTAPAAIARGYAEVRFTLDEFGTEHFSRDKNIYFSVYRSEGLSQRAGDGHYGYVRIRREESRNYFVEYKAYDRSANSSEGETRVCCRSDWNKYIGKTAVMRIAWGPDQNITLTYPDPDGSGAKTATRPYKVTDINYVVVGSENSYNASVYCFRYLSLTVVDLDGSTHAAGTSPTPLTVYQSRAQTVLLNGHGMIPERALLLDGRLINKHRPAQPSLRLGVAIE
ncbi:MAG: hypothetical protein GF331_10680 [Chitinivibrionales bacterium]|nr:hypothetical protein [Chitinivibrionales bacterium]